MTQRRDGWTPDRQARFFHALVECGSVGKAARSVGMSASGAYRLLDRSTDEDQISECWDQSVALSFHTLIDAAMDRAINGTANPVFYKGEQVGERVTHHGALTMFMLKMQFQESHREAAIAATTARLAAARQAPTLADGPAATTNASNRKA